MVEQIDVSSFWTDTVDDISQYFPVSGYVGPSLRKGKTSELPSEGATDISR